MKLLALLLLISCGKNTAQRCYSKEEALNYCVATRIAQTGESSYMANIYCAPKYQTDFCYSLGGI